MGSKSTKTIKHVLTSFSVSLGYIKGLALKQFDCYLPKWVTAQIPAEATHRCEWSITSRPGGTIETTIILPKLLVPISELPTLIPKEAGVSLHNEEFRGAPCFNLTKLAKLTFIFNSKCTDETSVHTNFMLIEEVVDKSEI